MLFLKLLTPSVRYTTTNLYPMSTRAMYTEHLKKKPKFTKPNKLRYSLKFASIVTPHSISKLSLVNSTANTTSKHHKLLVKQSYILLIWLMYLQGTYSEFDENQKTPSFFIHKKSQLKTTKLKTPMAHKTFSQEQFILKFYSLSISFQTVQSEDLYPKSVNASIFAALQLRQSLPFFTTNLLFLKQLRLTYKSTDQAYMLLN